MIDDTSPKTRSRQEILHYVLSFATSRIYDPAKAEMEWPRPRGASTGFVIDSPETPVQVGDLVLLTSARSSKWTLSWLREIRPDPSGDHSYLCESIEDGEQCWWSNVGISFLQRRVVDPRWSWTDKQWAFRDRWMDVCYKVKDAYIVRPLEPVFPRDRVVVLGTRTSHGHDDICPQKAFPDWGKITDEEMGWCYDECVAERVRELEKRKAAAEA